jgi:hypothetical protein
MRNQGLLSELNRGESQLCWQSGLILETDNIIILSFVWWGNGVDFSLNESLKPMHCM